ncbi:MAG: hypothetical protein CL920_36925 [Deltaproteobacteria bacterium]|nr:hypothetical protein [Deltaproteobacteria bacterium]
MINPLDKQLEENGILFGKYRLLSKLAVGGMAELFLAKQAGIAGFSKTVVIKCILPFFSQKQDFVTMFLDEARIAAHLNHPNVVQIYDISEFEGIYYMAMEYIPGQNLKHVRKRLASQSRYKENMPYGLLAGIFAQAAAGLEHVHTASDDHHQPLHLVHRDISPNNLMLSYEGILKVVDFGVAKAKSQEHETEVGVLKGRLSYMSPEHLSAQPIDGRSDLFALGIVLYEMSTGKRLFKRRSEAETIQALLTTPIPPPSRIKPGYPKKLEDILLKVLQRNPSERYQSAREFRLALEEFMEEEGRYYGVRQLGDAMQQLFPNEIANEKKGIRPSPVTQQDLLNLARGSYRVMQDNHFYQGSYNSFHDNPSPNPTQPQTSPTQTTQPKGPATASLGSPFAMPPQQKMSTASYNPPGQAVYQDEDATSITGEATQVGHTTEEIDEKTQIEVQVASADGLQAIQPVAPPMPGKRDPEQTRPLHPPVSPELVDEPEEPSKRSGLLIVLVALFFLGAGGGGAYWVINYMPSSQPPTSERREDPPPEKRRASRTKNRTSSHLFKATNFSRLPTPLRCSNNIHKPQRTKRGSNKHKHTSIRACSSNSPKSCTNKDALKRVKKSSAN